MSADTRTYPFDQGWRQERDRLRALEALFDSATTRRLAGLGLRDGRRCLEVGAGTGSIARWLAMRVGPSAVLEHIPDRERALARMIAAVRPGGWVVAEDLDSFVAVTAWGRRPAPGGAG